jgi:hypothetical protein
MLRFQGIFWKRSGGGVPRPFIAAGDEPRRNVVWAGGA